MADPIDLPSGIMFLASDMRPFAIEKTARMEGRHLEAVQSGFAYWIGRFSSRKLTISQLGWASAWLLNASSAGVTFLGYDVTRPRPYMENTGAPLSGVKALGGAFDGSANLVSITNSREVIVDGLPAGFQLVAGDYLEFNMSAGVRSLHMIMVDATANGSGEVTLNFRDGLDIEHFNTSAIVRFEQPSCVMKVIGKPPLPKADGERRLVFSAEEAPQQ